MFYFVELVVCDLLCHSRKMTANNNKFTSNVIYIKFILEKKIEKYMTGMSKYISHLSVSLSASNQSVVLFQYSLSQSNCVLYNLIIITLYVQYEIIVPCVWYTSAMNTTTFGFRNGCLCHIIHIHLTHIVGWTFHMHSPLGRRLFFFFFALSIYRCRRCVSSPTVPHNISFKRILNAQKKMREEKTYRTIDSNSNNNKKPP